MSQVQINWLNRATDIDMEQGMVATMDFLTESVRKRELSSEDCHAVLSELLLVWREEE